MSTPAAPHIPVGDEPASVRSQSGLALAAIAWRQKRVVVLVVFLCVAAAVLLSLRQTKSYEGTASLLFRDPGFARTLYGNDLFAAGQDPQRTAQTNIDVVGSTNVAAVARQILKSDESVTSLAASVSVEPSSDSDVAKVTATRGTPEDAANVANAFADGYIRYRQKTDRDAVRAAKLQVERTLASASAETRPGILRNQRQLEVLETLQTGNAEVVDRAQPNSTPVSPRPKRNAIFGLILGLLAGFALALLVDLLDRRLRDEDDVLTTFPDFPLLAAVPNDPRAVAGNEVSGRTGEAYRMLREGLYFEDSDHRARSLLVTSTDEGEGKSTVARHLAILLASSGQEVLLIEADMRRPTSGDRLGVSRSSRGLSNALTSGTPVHSLVQRPMRDIPSFMILPSGPVPGRPADLLRGDVADDVLMQAREIADVVIIDAPPLLPVSDARALLQSLQIDAVLMVARVGVTRRDRARDARRVLDQAGRRVIGLVVTASGNWQPSSYYDATNESSVSAPAGVR